MIIAFSYPRPRGISARCLARLLKGETLKHREADDVTGSYRLAAFICYLEQKHGWEIQRREVNENTKDPTGRTAKYMEYWLQEHFIKWAGKEGQEYVEKVFEIENKRIAERLAATSPTANDNPVKTDNSKPNMESDLSNDHNHGQE